MIISKDDKFTYGRQLTVWLPRVKDLAFALENFAEDKKANCVVRKSLAGYAVFVKPIVMGELDSLLLAKERQELEGSTLIVDYMAEYANELLEDSKG